MKHKEHMEHHHKGVHHKGHPHHKYEAMGQFNEGHWSKDQKDEKMTNAKYTSGEMSNPEHLKKSVDMQTEYLNKHRMKYP